MLFYALVKRLFNVGGVLPVHLFGLLVVVISLGALYGVAREVFGGSTIAGAAVMLSATFLPLVLFTAFVCNGVPSLTFYLLTYLLRVTTVRTDSSVEGHLTCNALSTTYLFITL